MEEAIKNPNTINLIVYWYYCYNVTNINLRKEFTDINMKDLKNVCVYKKQFDKVWW